MDAIVESVHDYFSTNFPTKAAAINTRFGDSVSIEFPKEYRWDDPLAYSGTLSKFPVCNILGTAMDIPQWGTNYEHQTHQIAIWLTATHQNAETLRRQLYRYALAISELLKDGHFDTAVAWSITGVIRLDFSPLLTRNNILTGDVRILATIEEIEHAS